MSSSSSSGVRASRGSSSSSSSAMDVVGHGDLTERVLNFLRGNPEGVSNDEFEEHFGSLYGATLTGILNTLLERKRVVLFHSRDAPDSLVYQLVPEEMAAKFEGLGPEQMLVYQICERAGNKGIWTRDLKLTTNIPQHTLNKTLKILEQRSLVKSVRSVVSKSRKLYMLFSATPAKEVTGGPWYTDQEFDHAFVEDLCKMILGIVKQSPGTDSRAILERLTSTGVIEASVLTLDDLDVVMRMLVYDGRLEEMFAPLSSAEDSKLPLASLPMGMRPPARYKVAKEVASGNHLTETPCGVCPVISQCCEGGVISPTTCVYMDKWLDEF